jgi:hypothetical protein
MHGQTLGGARHSERDRALETSLFHKVTGGKTGGGGGGRGG